MRIALVACAASSAAGLNLFSQFMPRSVNGFPAQAKRVEDVTLPGLELGIRIRTSRDLQRSPKPISVVLPSPRGAGAHKLGLSEGGAI